MHFRVVFQKMLVRASFIGTVHCLQGDTTKKFRSSAKYSADNDEITRAAIGRFRSIGALYNAHEDKFVEGSIFKKEVPNTAITTVDISNVCANFANTVTEKSNRLSVDSELQASIIAGFVNLEGFGDYFSKPLTSSKNLHSSLIYKTTTKQETLNLDREDLQDCFVNKIEDATATHVVVGITWGANLILDCSQEINMLEEQNQSRQEFHAKLTQLASHISNNRDVDDLKSYDNRKFTVNFSGDIDPLHVNLRLPISYQEAIELTKEFPSMMRTVNMGKGKPLTYVMIPLSKLKRKIEFVQKETPLYYSIEEEDLFTIFEFEKKIRNQQQQVDDLLETANLSEGNLEAIRQLKNYICRQLISFKSGLATVLRKMRSGDDDPFLLEDFLDSFDDSSLIHEKIELFQKISRPEITFIGNSDSLQEEISKQKEETAMVWHFSSKLVGSDSKTDANLKLFLQALTNNDPSQKLYVIDYDSLLKAKAGSDSKNSVQIVQASTGLVLIEDLFKKEALLNHMAVVRGTPIQQKEFQKPQVTAWFHTPCPCDPSKHYSWKCSNCLKFLEYGFDDHLYCLCGKTPLYDISMRCSEQEHVEYVMPTKAVLRTQALSLKPLKSINVLLLGRTGVGKSTFINSFYNLITYQTLMEAEQGKFLSKIPIQFDVRDEKLKKVTVSTGTDPNEVFTKGQSSTQTCKTYTFPYGNSKITLIDTPGIGDTRGVDQDEENFKDILSSLTKFDEIHGVCILLKPDDSRADALFRFCINELLTSLHKDAAKNILFCFTHSRNTFYKPGGTLDMLEEILKTTQNVQIPVDINTVYCFDSEPYMLLAALHNKPPVTSLLEERNNYAESWKRSYSELYRFIQKIMENDAHKMQKTVDLNKTRNLVLNLSRPIADITTNIRRNQALMETELNEIHEMDEDIKQLKTRLWTTRIVLKQEKLSHPRTVCGHFDCKITPQDENETLTNYPQICHSHCYLKRTVAANTRGDPGLLKCGVMDPEGTCKKCKHSYRDHLHIFYNSEEVTERVQDKEVLKAVQDKINAKELKQEMILNKKREINEYNMESEKLECAAAIFAYFLKTNSIFLVNDAHEDYLNYLIALERMKKEKGDNFDTLIDLEQSLESYKEQKRILEKNFSKGDQYAQNELTIEDILELVKQLKSMKHSGRKITEALDCINHGFSLLDKQDNPLVLISRSVGDLFQRTSLFLSSVKSKIGF